MRNDVIKACGLDVHQASVTACIMRQGIERQIKTFGTTTSELLSLKAWLQQHEITHVAMESTGVFWKPVLNVLGEAFTIILANARHIKNVPGRKTDVKDCEWICQLLRAGLLEASFIPPSSIRELRDVMRYQKKLQHQLTAQKNRMHKLLQEANIKITSVLSDIFGVTGMRILRSLAQGVTDPEVLSQYLSKNKKLVPKISQAKAALTGCFSTHHQFLLQSHLRYYDFITTEINNLEQQTNLMIQPFKTEYDLLQSIPGVKDKAAKTIIAEIGVDMSVFPTSQHLSSWAGLCPGNNESAGKKKALA
jgi:transposase